MKYWGGPRAEAEGADGKERVRRIPFSGLQRTSDAASPESFRGQLPLPPRAQRVASILSLAGVARLAEIAADIGYASPARTARALANAKIHSNAAHPSISTVS